MRYKRDWCVKKLSYKKNKSIYEHFQGPRASKAYDDANFRFYET